MATIRHFNLSSRWLAAALLVATVAACDAAPSRIVQSSSQVVPTESMQDLVTYGDVLVKFTVVGESEIPATDDETKRGEGTITRQVAASQDGEALWSRPSREKSAATPPAKWVISDGGWFFTKSEKLPLEVEGRSPLVVGAQYLAVRTFSSLGGDTKTEWFSLGYIPLQQGSVQFDSQFLKDEGSYAKALQGLPASEVARILEETEVDPKVAPYMNLDAAERYQKQFG